MSCTVTTFSLLYAADFADRLEHEILPALQAGFIVVADRYMYTAFARNAVMGADPEWSRKLFGMALVPDLVLYLRLEVDDLVPRVIQGKGMDYWESGMHLALGSDIFDSFVNYQTRLIREYDKLAEESGFITVDARRSSRGNPGRASAQYREVPARGAGKSRGRAQAVPGSRRRKALTRAIAREIRSPFVQPQAPRAHHRERRLRPGRLRPIDRSIGRVRALVCSAW